MTMTEKLANWLTGDDTGISSKNNGAYRPGRIVRKLQYPLQGYSLMFPIKEICNEIDPPLNNLDAGSAFMYLYRRFGFPNIGSDDHKHVCAYVIPCEVKNTVIILYIHGGSCGISWTGTEEPYRHYHDDERDTRQSSQKTEFMEQCHEAVRKVLNDLLRPVYVRDTPIWIFGKEGPDLPAAEHSKTAGYGLPADLFEDIDMFYELLELARIRGTGNFALGAKYLVEGE